MAGTTRASRSMTRQVIIVAVLLLLLLALAVFYYLLTRAPEVSGSADERDRRFLFSIYGFEGDLLRRPTGVGFDEQGNIYVADTGKRRIVMFDDAGRFVRVYGEAGRDALQIYNPIDVAVAPDGTSWVVDKSLSKLVQYDVTGIAVREIEVEEPPTSVTISDDMLFVTTDSGVLLADLDGNLQTGYVRRGKEPGAFDRPGGVAVGEDGTLYISDNLNYRVQAISTKGEPIWQYGKPIPADQAVQFDSEDRKFGLPSNIALDDNGLLYVVDGLNSEVKVLTTEGELVEIIGDVGHADGMFYYPDGIAYADGRIAIADKFNDRVSVFRTPSAAALWAPFIPLLIALLLLPLLILPFLRRGRRYVVTPEFIEMLVADDERDLIAEALKRVHATPALSEAGEKIEDLDLSWKAHTPKSEDLEAVTGRFELGLPEAEALAIALGMRRKRVLITDDAAVRAAATELEVPVVTYDEIKQTIAEKSAGSDGAEPDQPAGDEPGAGE